ncbi:MAG: diaminohydroxyphosphoribosylaminopyrimidine deaminase [Frankiaceae bacterium]|nr:diaminohydroxyphosphoribosylaminopyrimidine deaminase [Frankiaceae bacterium]
MPSLRTSPELYVSRRGGTVNDADMETADSSTVAAMRRAIALSARGLGSTSPNPVVGCVILDADGAPAGEGWHQQVGGPHAEVHALRDAGDRARGGTAVVTLEPCNHTGRTGPCSQALLDAGIARVVFAVADPNAQAAGGAATLRDAGVDVTAGVLADEAAQVNEAWLHGVATGRPFVVWKYAASLDGQIAAADGSSRWITGADARRDVHRLRHELDAVLVGVGTVLADDPALTVRELPDGATPARQPLRVVLDRSGRTPTEAQVLDDAAETLVTAEKPADVLAELFGRGVRSVLLEGGPSVAGSFWQEGLVDKVVGYIAPVLLGSAQWPVLRGTGQQTIADAFRLGITEAVRLGADFRVIAYPDQQGS